MSQLRMNRPKITPAIIQARKAQGQRVAALTAYDFPTAQLLDAAGIHLILVGDSLGMVVLGYPDTTSVTMQEMLHHVRAVARAHPAALVAADLPFGSYDTPQNAVQNSHLLIQAGAQAVKAEGGREIAPQLQALAAAHIPFLGHLGMLPQSVLQEGGYHVKGKSSQEHQRLLDDADFLAQCGAFAVVLELVTPPVAREITARSPIPTIGIGSGPHCDGQILVTPDLLGTSPDFIPRHVKQRLHLRETILAFLTEWTNQVTLPPPDPTGA